MRLEEERRRAEQEAARLEAERMEAIIAKEELSRQAEDQLRSQEQLVSAQRPLRTKTLVSFSQRSSDRFDIRGNDTAERLFWALEVLGGV